MNNLPVVFENIVDETYAAMLHAYIKDLPFHYVEGVNRVKLSEKPKAKILHDIDADISAFVSGIYSCGQKRPDILMPLITATAKRLGIQVDLDNLIRIKANIVPPLLSKTANRLNLPHTDTNIPHLVFLYYLNDCDGDTVMFNKQMTEGMSNSDAAMMEDLEITHSITPKRNSMLVFEGSWYHTSTVPTQDYRMVININISYPGKITEYANPASWGA